MQEIDVMSGQTRARCMLHHMRFGQAGMSCYWRVVNGLLLFEVSSP